MQLTLTLPRINLISTTSQQGLRAPPAEDGHFEGTGCRTPGPGQPSKPAPRPQGPFPPIARRNTQRAQMMYIASSYVGRNINLWTFYCVFTNHPRVYKTALSPWKLLLKYKKH